MKIFLIAVINFLILHLAYSQTIEAPSPIKWYTLEQAMEMRKTQNRPLLIDVYTDWCGWCKQMMITTFSNSSLATYIQSNFYPVRFNAEGKDTIEYLGQKYVSKGKTHDLAIKLLDNRLSYPTIIFIDRDGNKSNIPGYLEVKDITPILVYFVEEINKTASFPDFNIGYMFTWSNDYKESISKLKPEEKIDTSGVVKWLDIKTATELNKKTPKIFFLDIYTDWSIPSKVMLKTTYTNPEIAKYLNENFYPIRFNAASEDSIQAFGQTFVSMGKGQPHQLAYSLLQGNMKFPANVYISSENQLLNIMNGYMSNNQLKPVLHFFGEKAYLTKKYQDFYNEFQQRPKN